MGDLDQLNAATRAGYPSARSASALDLRRERMYGRPVEHLAGPGPSPAGFLLSMPVEAADRLHLQALSSRKLLHVHQVDADDGVPQPGGGFEAAGPERLPESPGLCPSRHQSSGDLWCGSRQRHVARRAADGPDPSTFASSRSRNSSRTAPGRMPNGGHGALRAIRLAEPGGSAPRTRRASLSRRSPPAEPRSG